MAAYLYDRLVTEDEYRQRIRRHRHSSLLPLIATAAARYSTPERPQPRQVNATSAQIDQYHPAFAGIPTDRPRQALIVTLEPFPVANANLPHLGLPIADIPTTVVAAHEVERLVTLTDTTPSTLLLERAADPQRSTWALNECLNGHEGDRNPVLDQGWTSYPRATGRLSTPGTA
ncbi:hypothetical protein AB0L56_03860 [Streptomyces sp. NPDC052079]|uniref:hypothetical protein n=1 Tax=Streptomyces sp. NPDC052079 TaxID=3155526 RepID=UPI00342EA5F0